MTSNQILIDVQVEGAVVSLDDFEISRTTLAGPAHVCTRREFSNELCSRSACDVRGDKQLAGVGEPAGDEDQGDEDEGDGEAGP